MADQPQCLGCGMPLSAGMLGGLCPACLLKQGAAGETATGPELRQFEAPSASDLTKLFPQLEIVNLVGKGGMAAVYRARQPALERWVALKILPASASGDTGFAERFTREARALARLNHPNIVAVYEFGRVDGFHYLLMEYVDGVSLRQLQAAHRLSPREALQIVPQICDALQYAHDEGVVHRDIKPENVLIDRKGRVKIADFGLAKILGHDPRALRLTGEGQVMGTPHYMAPEQVEHPLEVDHRADIFSLGVVFYEMLTGELPLGRFEPPSRKVSVDVRLDEVVLRALEKAPERRYQHVAEVKTGLETIAASGGGPAIPTPARVRSAEVGMTASSGANVPQDNAGEIPPPRLSRLALVGLIWIALCVINYLWGYTRSGWALTGFLRGSMLGTILHNVIGAPLMVLGFAAPVGVTVLGVLALTKIRHSGGRLYGLGLALFTALVFPVIIIDSWLMWLGKEVITQIARGGSPGAVPAGTRGWIGAWVLLVAVMTLKLLQLAWRAARRPAPAQSWLSTLLGSAEDDGAESRRAQAQGWISKVAIRFVILAAVNLCTLETLNRWMVHQKESTGELWTMAHIAASLAALIWVAWPMYRSMAPIAVKIGASLGLPVCLLALGFVWNLHLRPNLGLYEEDDWVAQHPGFQWGWRQGIATKLWRKPIVGPYGPLTEIVLHPDKDGVVLLDLDSGRRDLRSDFDANLPDARELAREQHFDVVITVKEEEMKLLGLDLGIVPVSHLSQDGITAQQASDYWLLERKQPKELTLLNLATNRTLAAVFRTREGAIGLMQYEAVEHERPGLKMRFKSIAGTGAKPPDLATASAEVWAPAPSPGQKINPSKILDEAKELMRVGRYEEALQRHIWYRNHALEIDPSLSAVRASFALSDWVELGRRYPKAKQALVEIRDHSVREFMEGRGYSDLFMELSSLNSYLQEEDSTFGLYMGIYRQDPALAQQCYFYAEDLLVRRGEYDLCLRYIGDPQRRFEMIRRSWEQEKKMEDQREERAQQFPGLLQPPKLADKRFVDQTRKLIMVLVANGHKSEAESMLAQAVTLIDNAQLKSAVKDAEAKTRK